MTQLEKLTLFYDGACPLCQAEILFLSRRNQANLLDFVDINSAQFDPQKIGVSCEAALAAMYGQFADGKLIQGVSVFPEAYRRANLPRLAWFWVDPRRARAAFQNRIAHRNTEHATALSYGTHHQPVESKSHYVFYFLFYSIC